MNHNNLPARAELPSSKQLLRSTFLAAVAAVVLLVAVVLPAEYGVDPTGIGRVLRMTDMGEIKQQLAADAAADAATSAAASAAPAQGPAPAPQPAAREAAPATAAATPAPPRIAWRDEMPFTLSPGEGTEIKLTMTEGAQAQYAWVVEGGAVNFDTHGDGPGRSISYEKGRGVAADEGVLQAAFTGNHGWYWRNRGQADVRLILRTRGDYSAIKRMK